jgi:hypothetical protein
MEATLTRIALSRLDIDLDGIAARPGDADIVDENVEPAPGFHRARDDRLTGCGNADITLDDLRNTAFGIDQPSCLIRPLRNSIDQRHLRAVPRQNDRGGAAIADTLGTRTRTGDDGDLALEAVVSANCRHGVSPDLFLIPNDNGNGLSAPAAKPTRKCRLASPQPAYHQGISATETNSKARTCIAASAWRSW